MIVYNVTVKVQHSIAEAFMKWMREEHIPEIINTGCFTHANILEVLEVDDSEGPTYAIQYHADSKAMYNRYIEKFAPAMRQDAIEKWGDGFIAFRSVLQVI